MYVYLLMRLKSRRGDLRRHLTCKERESAQHVLCLVPSFFFFFGRRLYVHFSSCCFFFFCLFFFWSSCFITTARLTDSFHMNDFRVYWLCSTTAPLCSYYPRERKRYNFFFFLYCLMASMHYFACFPSTNEPKK